MADLDDKQAAQSIKIIGADSSGLETNPVGADVSGNLKTIVNNGSGSAAVNIQDGGNSITVDGTVTANQGTPSSTANAWPQKLVGGTDGTLIGNSGDKLKVDANLSQGQLVPTITNKLRFRYVISDVSLPNTGAYQSIYSRSGTGLIFGFQLGFDNAKVNIRLTIDGGQVFDISLDDIKKFEFNDTTDGRMQMGGFLTAIGNVLDFSSRFAIPYNSNILVEAASNDGASHKLKQYIVILTEDT